MTQRAKRTGRSRRDRRRLGGERGAGGQAVAFHGFDQ
jgi:hypothetical protein